MGKERKFKFQELNNSHYIYDEDTGEIIDIFPVLSKEQQQEELAIARLGKKSLEACPSCNKNYLQKKHNDCYICAYCEMRYNADKSKKSCVKCQKNFLEPNYALYNMSCKFSL
jgi:hypothetical protein